MRRRKHLEIRPPTVKRKPQIVLANFFENPLPQREPALATDVHLDEIRAALVEQIHEARLIRLVLPRRNRKLGGLL